MRYRSVKLAFSLLPFLVLPGCRSEAPQQLAQVRDSAGVRIVENRCPDDSPGPIWRLSAAPIVEIGVQEGDPDYELFGARSSARLSDGKIVVANAGAYELRWYDAAGSYLGTAGRQGGGPGEFEGIDRVARLAGDSVLAYDDEQNRISVFGAGGELARTATLRGPRGFLAGVFDDGSLLITAQVIEGLSEGLSRWKQGAFRYNGDGEFLDTLGVFPGIEWVIAIGESGVGMRSRPFGRSASFAVWGSTFYAGTQDEYEIAVYGADGDLVASVRLDCANPPVTAADIEAHKAEELAEAADEDERRQVRSELDGLPYPQEMPAYGRIAIDAEGNLWIAEYRPTGREQPRWLVFDSEYRLLGAVETPPVFVIHEIGSDYVLGRARDELGVEYIRLYQLVEP